LEHVEEAKARRRDPDCPQFLEEVFERWGVAFVEAQIECKWPFVFGVEQFFL
jgi:hypothetical protein